MAENESHATFELWTRTLSRGIVVDVGEEWGKVEWFGKEVIFLKVRNFYLFIYLFIYLHFNFSFPRLSC